MSLVCKVPAHIQTPEGTEASKQFLLDAAFYNLTPEGMALQDFNPIVPEGFTVEKDEEQGTIKLKDPAGWTVVQCTEI